MRRSFEQLHAATIKCWSNERGTDQWTDTTFLPSSRCSVSSMTTCTLEQLSDFLWMPPHQSQINRRQHSSFNQQMSKEENTQSASYLLSLSLKDDKALEYGGALLMFHHIFLSHTESMCAAAQPSPEENPLELPNLPACCSSGGALWLAGYTRCHIHTHTHTRRESQLCFFPSHISYPFALSRSLFLLLYICDSTSLTLSFSLFRTLPLRLQQREAHMFSVVSSAGSVWFKAIMWLQKET